MHIAVMLQIDDRGVGNQIVLPSTAGYWIQGHAVIGGDSNHLEIGDESVSSNIYAYLGSNCKVRIGVGCSLGNLFIHAMDRGEVIIGSRSGFNGSVRLLLHEPGRITIGEGCLFAGEVDVTISDMHSIVDVITGQRVNPARDVVLEDRIWVGQRVTILKGSHIGKGSIIGACSLVSGEVPPNCVAAGIPAKAIRTGVTWRHELIY
jgi:acetyltransferase-like isoleucine patch superfamily enzyme